jgi:hypothetical protein
MTDQINHHNRRSKYEQLQPRKLFILSPQHGGSFMKRLSKLNVLLVAVMVVGFSIASAGCNENGGEGGGGRGGGITGPGPTTTTPLNTTITLSMNNNFCASLTFRLTEVWNTTVSVTGPYNTDPDFSVSSPTGQVVVSGYSSDPGAETATFEPPMAGTYDLEVCEYQDIGGTFTVLVTQTQ